MDQLTLPSQIAKVYELATRLKADKENYELLEKQYAALIAIVEAADNQDDLPKDFLASIKASKEQIVQEIPNLTNKIAYLNVLIAQHEHEAKGEDIARMKVEDIISLLFTAMGIADGENKSE